MTSVCRLPWNGPIAVKMLSRGEAEYFASCIQQHTTHWHASTQEIHNYSIYRDIHITAALSPIIVEASSF